MKYKILLMSFFSISFWFSLKCMENNPLKTKRLSENYMISSFSGPASPNEFQLTLIAARNSFLENIPPKQYAFLTLIPYIGKYGTNYPMRTRIALIQADPAQAYHAYPLSLKNVFSSLKIAQDAKVECVIVVYGEKIAPEENIVLHPWAYTWQNKLYFDVFVDMGLFEPDGLQSTDISLNNLKGLKVIPHNGKGLAFSPNNAKISVSPPDREISTTWFMAVSPTKKNSMISFFILANTQNAENIINNVTGTSTDLESFLINLSNAATSFKEYDAVALKNAVKTIKNIALGKEDKTPTKFTNNEKLLLSLQEFTKSLTNLHNILSA